MIAWWWSRSRSVVIPCLIHLIPTVPRYQLALWVVPLYCSGHYFCGLQTEHYLNPLEFEFTTVGVTIVYGPRHILRYAQRWALQDSAAAAILHLSSRECSERDCQSHHKVGCYAISSWCRVILLSWLPDLLPLRIYIVHKNVHSNHQRICVDLGMQIWVDTTCFFTFSDIPQCCGNFYGNF